MSWTERAACRDDPAPECWFPDSPGRISHEARVRAMLICASCPVRNECLEDELRWLREHGNEPHGIRAGLTERQRRALVSTA